jgi:perosamine synthetase
LRSQATQATCNSLTIALSRGICYILRRSAPRSPLQSYGASPLFEVAYFDRNSWQKSRFQGTRAGVEPGDEVIIPGLTFVATANAVSYTGALPHIVDSEPTTMGIDAARLRSYLEQIADLDRGRCINRLTGRRIAAIMPVHLFGIPCDIDGLIELSGALDLPVVEDAAEALGSTYKETHCGRFGKLGCLSFNGNKTVTTGGGGAVLTDDSQLAARCRHLTTTAKRPHRWHFSHDAVGYNYRLPNLNAALGCAQLERFDQILAKKRALAAVYQRLFGPIDGVRFFEEPAFCRSNYWLCTIVIDHAKRATRDQILEQTNAANVMTRPIWTAMHHLPMYTSCPRMDDLSVTESLEQRIINLPSSPKLMDPPDA